MSLHSVLSGVRWTLFLYHVLPISTRRLAESTFMYVVMPTALPAASTAHGNIVPCRCKSSRRSISARILSGIGTEVYHRFHSSPSFTASTRSSWWAWESGASVAWQPVSVMGASHGIGDFLGFARIISLPTSPEISPLICTDDTDLRKML